MEALREGQAMYKKGIVALPWDRTSAKEESIGRITVTDGGYDNIGLAP